jgi:hypothetical protein
MYNFPINMARCVYENGGKKHHIIYIFENKFELKQLNLNIFNVPPKYGYKFLYAYISRTNRDTHKQNKSILLWYRYSSLTNKCNIY